MALIEDGTTATHAAAPADNSRRNVLIVASVIAALIVVGFIFVLLRAAGGDVNTVEQRLAGAIRPGDPQFEAARAKIVLDEPEALEATRPVGDVWMQLETTVRNFTGRTITGLEVKGTVVDLEGNPVKERTVIVVPTASQPTLENNKTLPTTVVINGINKDSVKANIKMEVVGVKFQ